MLINEINLKGVIKRDRTGFVAMIQGPDNKTYIVQARRPADGRDREVDRGTTPWCSHRT